MLRNSDEARDVAFRIFMIILLAAQTGVLFAANAKVIGDEDTRELIGPNDTDHAAAVGMVYCEKTVTVIEKGKEEKKTFRNKATGTLVVNTKTVLATAHGFYEEDRSSGEILHEYDYADECEYHKFLANGDYRAYSFVYARFGNYEGKNSEDSTDWAVLQLKEKAVGQKALAIEDLNPSDLKIDSTYKIEIIGHQHDKNDDTGLYHSDGIMRALSNIPGSGLAHTADTEGRASGAGIVYTYRNGDMFLRGIHIGAYGEHDLNKFIPINSDIMDAVRDVLAHKQDSI